MQNVIFFILIISRQFSRGWNWNFSEVRRFVSNDPLDWTLTKIRESGGYWSGLVGKSGNSQFYSRSNSVGLRRFHRRSLRNFGWDRDTRDRNARASFAHGGAINLDESFRILLPCRTRSCDSETRRKFPQLSRAIPSSWWPSSRLNLQIRSLRSLEPILTIGAEIEKENIHRFAYTRG